MILAISSEHQYSLRRHLEHASSVHPIEFVDSTADLPMRGQIAARQGDDVEMIIVATDSWKSKIAIEMARHQWPGAVVAALLCSSMGEWDLDKLWPVVNERLDWLEQGVIDHFFVADREIERVLKDRRITDLPQVLDLKTYKKSQDAKALRDSPSHTFGILSHDRPRKNMANQLAGISMIGLDAATYHLEPHNIKWAQRLGLDLRVLEGGSHDQHLENLRSIRVGCQVTYSESFNYTAAEYVMHRIPVVVGPSVWWAPKWMKVQNPDGAISIARCLDEALSWDEQHLEDAHDHLIACNDQQRVRLHVNLQRAIDPEGAV